MHDWQRYLISITNTGLSLTHSDVQLDTCQQDYHALAREILMMGVEWSPNKEDPCVAVALLIAEQHAPDAMWNGLPNKAWMEAHHATADNQWQWLARAAAKSAHNEHTGWAKDLAITAAWVTRATGNPREAWRQIRRIIS